MRTIFVFLIFVVLSYFYLYPGSQALLDGRTDTFMSDGTDATTLPYIYDVILKVWHDHPSRYFYGAIYSEVGDPERGIADWMPWNERWPVLFYSHFLPVEQLGTATIASLMVISAFCMYLLCVYLGWSRMISLGLGIAWGFCCYTRARAKVHGPFAGIYHVPLIFLGLLLVVRGKSKRSLLAAAMSLLLAGTVAHYYLLTCIFLSPLFILFVLIQPEFRSDWKRISSRFCIALVPLLVFLAFNFQFALPSDARLTGQQSMASVPLPAGQIDPFLYVYYARAIDFLGGDISLQMNGLEWNPLRKMVNETILSNLDRSNPHERTNGIRWSILILGICALVALMRGRYAHRKDIQNNVIFFLIFGLFTFWQASGVNFPTSDFNPSYWLYMLCTKIRVASRAGINVHFALLMLAGYFLSTDFKWRKFFVLPGVFALIMVLDYPPVQTEPMAPIYPVYSALTRDKGPCGTGMAFPYFNGYVAALDLYQFEQRMRGSDCTSLNQMFNIDRVKWLNQRFPPNNEFLGHISENRQANDLLEKMVNCVPLNWIVFHAATPRPWAEGFCQRLGWQLNPDMSCVSPQKGRPLVKLPDECP